MLFKARLILLIQINNKFSNFLVYSNGRQWQFNNIPLKFNLIFHTVEMSETNSFKLQIDVKMTTRGKVDNV